MKRGLPSNTSTAEHGTVVDSQKTDPKCRFVPVEFLVSDSSIARAKEDFNWHESHCPVFSGDLEEELLMMLARSKSMIMTERSESCRGRKRWKFFHDRS